ncbi:MAG: ABC transporter permease subunit [Anaerolineales bacterium]|nr:ABC transporter permease subunit [Anaerolineales bacterium]
MTNTPLPVQTANEATLARRAQTKTLTRVTRYFALKTAALLLTVAVGLYLTILIVNLGGFVDKIFRAQIAETLGARMQAGWLRDLPPEESNQTFLETQWAMEEAAGLHEPFLARSLRWLGRALVLDLGKTATGYFFSLHSGRVEVLVLQHLPYTLSLVGISNLLLFFASVFAALFLSRKPNSLLDRLVAILSPISSAPSWIYGVILILLFAGTLRVLPYPRPIDLRDMKLDLHYLAELARLMILPILSIFLSVFFQGIYSWRTYFLIYSEEDYVELGRAKGLSPRALERQYILRPTLPAVITSFAILMISLWQGSLALEWLFEWPGVGTLFVSSIANFNTPLALGIVTVFAYLLALTVLLLDLVYALVDPRVQIENGSPSVRPEKSRRAARHDRRIRRWQEVRLGATERRRRRIPDADGILHAVRKALTGPGQTLRNIVRQPIGAIGLLIILFMIGLSIFTMVSIPADRAIRMWQAQAGEGNRTQWYMNPTAAMPEWTNWFRAQDLPATTWLDSRNGDAERNVTAVTDEMTEIDLTYSFEYAYASFPQDIILYLHNHYEAKLPLVSLTWVTPDGREIDIGRFTLAAALETQYISRDERLQRRLGGQEVIAGLFGDPQTAFQTALPGTYQLRLQGFVFEEGADLDAELIVYGQVSGWAGTDHLRRDIGLPLLWGMPVALACGLLGALATTLLAMVLAALGAWLGGWVDGLIQRLCEVNMILPTLPIAILVYMMYSKTIWAILGVIILLSIFGNTLKNYRAIFLQVKEMPYIEAARCYGAKNWRVIWHYLVPRILPVMIPQLVIMVPGYVFYEATLAYLRVSDPYLPTWGKVIYDALTNHALQYHLAWLLEPVALLLIMATGFALLGIALDRVLNPRLQQQM